MTKLKWAAAIAMGIALLMSATPAASAAPAAAQPVNWVFNSGAVAVGAIQQFDGQYRHGTYDDLIPVQKYSGYAYTAGLYIGPGYCLVWQYHTGAGYTPIRRSWTANFVIDSSYPGVLFGAFPSNHPNCLNPL